MFKKWFAMLVTMALLVGMAACSLADESTESVPFQIGDGTEMVWWIPAMRG